MVNVLQVCLVQSGLAWERPADNRARFTRLIDAGRGADLIVLPEMFSTGFSMNAERLAEAMEGDTVTWMKTMADSVGAAVCGSVIVSDRGSYYNRFVLAHPSGELLTYDKRHLFRMSTENDHYKAGGDRLVLPLNNFAVFPQICYDLRFPVFSRNNLGFDLMIYVANWPAARRAHWRTLLAARAIENQCYVVGVNRIGTDGNGVEYAGDSMAIGFDGSVLLDLAGEDTTGEITLEHDALRDYRDRFPAWKDADPFSLD